MIHVRSGESQDLLQAAQTPLHRVPLRRWSRPPTLLLLLLLLPPRLGVAEGGATAEIRAAAKDHYLRGKAAFQEADYDRAITEYSAANRLLPMPELNFNLGQAHRLAGHCEAAGEAYRRFLAVQSTGPLADEARRYLIPCPPPPPPDAVAPTQAPPGTVALVAATAPPVSQPVWKRRWLWTAVGVAVVVGSVGIGVAATTRVDAPRPPANLGDVEVRF